MSSFAKHTIVFARLPFAAASAVGKGGGRKLGFALIVGHQHRQADEFH